MKTNEQRASNNNNKQQQWLQKKENAKEGIKMTKKITTKIKIKGATDGTHIIHNVLNLFCSMLSNFA